MKYNLSPKKYGTHGIILNKIPSNSIVLDVGCAGGYLSHILSEKKYCNVVGMDIDEHSIKEARKYCHNTILGNVEETIDGVKEKYDIILIADILEHLINPSIFLKKASKKIKKNGYMIISMPNIACLSIRTKLLLGSFNYTKTGILDETHLHFYTRSSAKKLITDSDLIIDEIIPIGELNYSAGKIGYTFTKLFPTLLATQFVWKVRPNENH